MAEDAVLGKQSRRSAYTLGGGSGFCVAKDERGLLNLEISKKYNSWKNLTNMVRFFLINLAVFISIFYNIVKKTNIYSKADMT